jgi:hypothetical protein
MSATPPGSPGARAASREAKPESSLLPYLIRRSATLRAIAARRAGAR